MFPSELIALIFTFLPVDKQAKLSDDKQLSSYIDGLIGEMAVLRKKMTGDGNLLQHYQFPGSSLRNTFYVLNHFDMACSALSFKMKHEKIDRLWHFAKRLDFVTVKFGDNSVQVYDICIFHEKEKAIEWIPTMEPDSSDDEIAIDMFDFD